MHRLFHKDPQGNTQMLHKGEAGIFLTWPWCNQNKIKGFRTERQHLHVVQPTMCSMLSVYDIHLPANLGPFHVLSLRVRQHAVKVFLPPFYLWQCSREKKIPSSPCLHNFNVHVPKSGSLGTRIISPNFPRVPTSKSVQLHMVSTPEYLSYESTQAKRRAFAISSCLLAYNYGFMLSCCYAYSLWLPTSYILSRCGV